LKAKNKKKLLNKNKVEVLWTVPPSCACTLLAAEGKTR
jgi:hypothetical protein